MTLVDLHFGGRGAGGRETDHEQVVRHKIIAAEVTVRKVSKRG